MAQTEHQLRGLAVEHNPTYGWLKEARIEQA
jgi:hypothetical protein